MNIWLVAIVELFAVGASSQEAAFFQVSADPAVDFPVLAGLDSAIAYTGSLSVVTLYLLPGAFSISTSTTIQSELTLQGKGQSINIEKSLTVCKSLIISNSTLTSNIKDLSMFSLAGGSLLIENSSVTFSSATIAVGRGIVVFQGMNFNSNSAPIVSIFPEGPSVQVLRCDVWNHTGVFVQVLQKASFPAKIFLLIDRMTFRGNRGTGYLLTYSAPLFTGSVSISNTEFISNAIPLLYFDVGEIQASITGCKFLDNNQTTLTIYAAGAVFIIADSHWDGNAQTMDIRQLVGDVLVTRIAVTNQRVKGIINIQNTRSADQCRFSLDSSHIHDIDVKVTELSPGVLYASSCTVLMTRCVVQNVRMNAVHMRYMFGLIYLNLGLMEVSNLTLHNSGSPNMGIIALGGGLNLADSLIDNLQCGGNVYTGVTDGNFFVRNITFTQPAEPFSEFPNDETGADIRPFFFAGFLATVEILNSQTMPGPLDNVHAHTVSVHYGKVNITNYFIRDLSVDTVGSFYNSDGVVTNVTVVNCSVAWGVFAIYNYQAMKISGLFIRDAVVTNKTTGTFVASMSLHLECNDFVFHNFTARYLFASTLATISMKNVSVTDSNFVYFFDNQVNVSVSVAGMVVRRTTGGLAFASLSSLRLVDSFFENLLSRGHVLVGGRVNITLERVVLKDFSSSLSLSRFEEESHLLISQSHLSQYTSTADEAFIINTGTVIIVASKFFSFNVTILQASGCAVAIQSSRFQAVRVTALSSKSDSAYGGVLGCSDCPSVSVESSSFLNISTIFGGAIAVRSSSTQTRVYIESCEFVMCSARAGGAVYLQQSSFVIESSNFIGNKAEQTGGAIDAYTNSDLDTRVRNCTFIWNNAREGGAVKWRDSEVSFVNATFLENSALYGANIASFGVALFGYVVSVNGSLASGYPLHLVFELQDHYRQRVATAATQDLELQRSSNVYYRGNVATTISQGIFNFSELTIYAKPNSRQTVQGVMSYVEKGKANTLNGSIDIDFRDCVPGEVRKEESCEYCFPGNVSFHPSDAECSYCPSHAYCPGGNVMHVNSHYWRSSNTSMKLVACPLKETCLGGENSECAQGYTGNLCTECSDGYTRYRTIECEHCGSRIISWLKISLVAVPSFVLIRAMKAASEFQLFVLKSIINHAQFLSVLSSIRALYPAVLKHSFHSLSYLSSLFLADFPLLCVSSKPAEYTRAIIGSALSPALLLSLLIRKDWQILCTSALMFAPLIALSTLTPLLACRSVDSEAEWLFLDMKEQCWGGTHLLLVKAMVVPSVIINVILPLVLIPTAAIVSPAKFDVLFPLWRSGVEWRCWDLLLYCAKCTFTVVVVVSVSTSQLSQVVYGLLVLIVVSVLAAGMSAFVYKRWKCFVLTESSLVIVAVSMGLCAYFIYHSPTEGVTDWLVTTAFLALNAGYFIVCTTLWRQSPTPDAEGEIIAPNNSLEVLNF